MPNTQNVTGVYLISVLSFCGVAACFSAGSIAAEQSTSVARISNNTVINSYVSSAAPRIKLQKRNVVIESDGSITPKEIKIVDVLAAFESGVGAAVNLELVFAQNSIVLTAEGKETLGIIADAIRYQESDVRVDLELPSHQTLGRDFTERRANEIVRLLKSRYGVRNPLRVFITSSNSQKGFFSTKTAQSGSDIQRLTILNMGRNG